MKKDKGGSVDMIMIPAAEFEVVMKAIKQAEKAGDIGALKWCVRRLVWLNDTSEISGGDDHFFPAFQFNKAWDDMLEADPPPASIAAVTDWIDRYDEPDPEPITAADAGEALETIKAFFEESLPKKIIAAAMEAVGDLQNIIKTAEAGQ